jgi:hypothetical protein
LPILGGVGVILRMNGAGAGSLRATVCAYGT